MASYFKVGDNPGIGDEKVSEQKQAVGDSPQVVLPYTASGDWTPGKYRLDVSADEQPGYIIVMEQPTMARTITRERDIIPGLGINREIFVDQTGSGVTLFHQEYVLTGAPTMSDTDSQGSPGSEKP